VYDWRKRYCCQKIVKLSALLIGVAMASFVSGGLAAAPRTITEADANRDLVLAVGQKLVLKLQSNPSTGYSWSLAESETPVLVSLGKPTYQARGALPGSGGVETWTLRAAKIGFETLKLEYRRPWEKQVPPAKTLLFRVTVK
jgi:inhibitor of cysteine peptidase